MNLETLLLRGDKMARDLVVHQKNDTNGNPVDRSNQNPILDTHLYEVEAPGGEMAEMAVNIIAKSINAQCDVNGNEY